MARWLFFGSEPSVLDSIRRWEAQGLVSPELARALSREAEARERDARRRFGQAAVAVTGGVLLLIAAAVFLVRAWPELTPAARTGIIAFLAVAVHGVGSLLLGRNPDSTLARVLQGSGLAVLLAAFVYSEEAWLDGSGSAVLVGGAALLVPLVLLPGALRAGPLPASLMTTFSYGYLAVFLDRALALGQEPLLWILDGVAVLWLLVLLLRLGREGPEGGRGWEVAVLLVTLYAGLVLTFLTSMVVLDLGEAAAWPLDAWLALIVGATLWGIHRAPPGLRRSWYPRNLAWAMLLAIPMGFWTLAETLEAPEWVTGAGVGALGALGLSYALRHDAGHLVISSCLALVAAAWFLGVEVGQAMGVAGALAFTAALLFWVSSRVGGAGASP